MTTSQNVSFVGPSPQQLLLQGPDLLIQQQQLERKQNLIDALRQQSLQQIDGGRGNISWTQGLAKLANAWAAGSMQKKNDALAKGVYQAMRDRQNTMFGLGPNGQRPPTQQPYTQSAPAPAASMPAPPTQTDPTFSQAFDAPTQQALMNNQPLPPMPAPQQAQALCPHKAVGRSHLCRNSSHNRAAEATPCR